MCRFFRTSAISPHCGASCWLRDIVSPDSTRMWAGHDMTYEVIMPDTLYRGGPRWLRDDATLPTPMEAFSGHRLAYHSDATRRLLRRIRNTPGTYS